MNHGPPCIELKKSAMFNFTKLKVTIYFAATKIFSCKINFYRRQVSKNFK